MKPTRTIEQIKEALALPDTSALSFSAEEVRTALAQQFYFGMDTTLAALVPGAGEVPAGFKLVPINPTRAMLDAAHVVHQNGGYVGESYIEMLAAAPAAPLPAQPEQVQPQQSGSIRPSAEPAGQHDAGASAMEMLQRFASWILLHRPDFFKDHACPRCVPEGGDLVDANFTCVLHEAYDVIGGILPQMALTYQVIRTAHGGGWLDADKDLYDNAADWNRRIIFVPVDQTSSAACGGCSPSSPVAVTAPLPELTGPSIAHDNQFSDLLLAVNRAARADEVDPHGATAEAILEASATLVAYIDHHAACVAGAKAEYETTELSQEVARLQNALCFWLPSVTDRDDDIADRILQDAFLLVGCDGNMPEDFKSAHELGWIVFSDAASPSPAPAPTETHLPARRFINVTGFLDADYVEFAEGSDHGGGVRDGVAHESKHYTRAEAEKIVRNGAWREVGVPSEATPASRMGGITSKESVETAAPAQQQEQSAPTDLSKRLRRMSTDLMLVHANDLLAAADEIERYYGGMLAWKQTAEKKDRDWNEDRVKAQNERCAARATIDQNIDTKEFRALADAWSAANAECWPSAANECWSQLIDYIDSHSRLAASPSPAPVQQQEPKCAMCNDRGSVDRAPDDYYPCPGCSAETAAPGASTEDKQ